MKVESKREKVSSQAQLKRCRVVRRRQRQDKTTLDADLVFTARYKVAYRINRRRSTLCHGWNVLERMVIIRDQGRQCGL